MARPTPRAQSAPPSVQPDSDSFHLGPINLALLVLGLLAVVAGFVALSGGSTVAAPLLLVLGYAVLIPLGIFR